jgi:hypothetical protein
MNVERSSEPLKKTHTVTRRKKAINDQSQLQMVVYEAERIDNKREEGYP